MSVLDSLDAADFSLRVQTCYGSFSVYRSSSGTTTADELKIKAEEKFEGMIRAFPPSKRRYCVRPCTHVRVRVYVDTVRLLYAVATETPELGVQFQRAAQ